MRKKLLSALLALCLCVGFLPLTAQAAGSAIPEESAEYEELRSFLMQFDWGWPALNQTYDFRSIVTDYPSGEGRNILQSLIGNAVCYAGPSPGRDRFYGETVWDGKDPLGKWGSYHKTNGDQTEWVLANVFNCSQTDIANLRLSLNRSPWGEYYLDGYYYAFAGGIGGPSPSAIITDIIPYEDYYFVTYELRYLDILDNNLAGRYFVVVQRKTIEGTGTGYWSLYYYRQLKDGEKLNLPTSSVDTPPDSIDSFIDVKQSDYYYNAVRWGVEQGIIYGTGANTFSPNIDCTVAQILTFLWRANGSPEPSINNPYSDVYGGSYYYKAALWAREKNLVWAGTFNADQPCTRAMAVNYLWKLAGSPVVTGNTFSDVPYTSEYVRAVLWAVSEGITGGTGGTSFSPDIICSRSQIITFIYRWAGFETAPAPNLPPDNTNTGMSWDRAYRDFVVDKKYLSANYDYSDINDPSHPWGTETEHSAALYDMDADGVPELFMFNGYTDRYSGMNYVYTFADGQIRYLGRIKELTYNPNSQFTGIWSYWTASGTDPDYYTYFWKEGNQLRSESVYSQEFASTYKKQETANTELYNAFVSTNYFSLPSLSLVAVSEIQSMGWDAFVSSSLN